MTDHLTGRARSGLPDGLAGLRGTALVRRRGDDVLRIAAGTSGARTHAELGAGTRFQLASVSKQFTAAAVLLLVDRRALSVEDRLTDVLAGPGSWRDITVHHLLCHTSGLVHWQGLSDLDLTEVLPADELLAAFAEPPLLSEPGARYAYSSPGYVLLAHVVQRASGQPYRTFLTEEIFAPLGMDATFAGNAGVAHDVATPLHEGARVRSFELDVIGMGAGDVWSTVDDLATWDDALEAGCILSPSSRREMLTPHAAIDEVLPGVTIEGYGYAWYVADVAGHRLFFHTGDNAGFKSINAVLPDDGASFMALTNDTATDLTGVSFELCRLAIGDAP